MTGLELVAGYLVAWGVRKLKRAGKRLDAETDEVIDAGLDRLHDAIAGKLGTDPALVKLEADVSQGLEPSDRARRRVQDAVEEAEVFGLSLLIQARPLPSFLPSAHNLRTVGGCWLSHQCPGEPLSVTTRPPPGSTGLSPPEHRRGRRGGGTSVTIAQMAVGLTQSMLNEEPPNNGHRQNILREILREILTHIGIAFYRDNSGTVRLTQGYSH
jgi:hypothetical protein